jgi:hypothetical protein
MKQKKLFQKDYIKITAGPYSLHFESTMPNAINIGTYTFLRSRFSTLDLKRIEKLHKETCIILKRTETWKRHNK